MSEATLDPLTGLLAGNRRTGDELPAERRKKVFVDPGGRIRVGDDLGPGEGQHLSEIHQALFAASRG